MTRRAYTSFTRGGYKWLPYWQAWQVGERRYSISEDCFYECLEEDIRLETRSLGASENKHEGQSPNELGYVHEEKHLRWKRV